MDTVLAGQKPPGGALARIHAGKLAAVHFPAFEDAEALSRGVERFQEGSALDANPFSPVFEAYAYGRILDMSDDVIDDYHRQAPLIAAAIDDAFGAGLDGRLNRALGALAAPVPLAVPVNAQGEGYAKATVRRYPVGGLIPPHCELEQLRKPTYADLRTRISQTTLLSYLLVLRAPEAGGDLAVYDLSVDDPRVPEFYSDRRVMHSLREGFTHRLVSLAAGDLLVFDGGRHFHQILPVEGSRPRWTLGGFLAPSRDGQTWYRWS